MPHGFASAAGTAAAFAALAVCSSPSADADDWLWDFDRDLGGPTGGVSLLQLRLESWRSQPSRLVDFQTRDAIFTEHKGYVATGDDLLVELSTIEQAKATCASLPTCHGFTFRGDLRADVPREVHFKSGGDFEDAAWTSFHLDSFTKQEGHVLPFRADLAVEMMTVEDAKAACAKLVGCKGFAAKGDPSVAGLLEIRFKKEWDAGSGKWTSFRLSGAARGMTAGIGSSLQRDAELSAAQSSHKPRKDVDYRFEAVDGGVGRACRGMGVTDSNAEYYNAVSAGSLVDCQDACVATAPCSGVEYNSQSHRCRIWTRSGGIGASSRTTRFFQCQRLIRLGDPARPAPELLGRAARGPSRNETGLYAVGPVIQPQGEDLGGTVVLGHEGTDASFDVASMELATLTENALNKASPSPSGVVADASEGPNGSKTSSAKGTALLGTDVEVTGVHGINSTMPLAPLLQLVETGQITTGMIAQRAARDRDAVIVSSDTA